MGKRTAQDLAQDVTEGLTNLEAAVIFHFRQNHYPPLPLSLVPLAIKIIKGEIDTGYVDLPDGITYQGQKKAPIIKCIEAWHLNDLMLDPDSYEQE